MLSDLQLLFILYIWFISLTNCNNIFSLRISLDVEWVLKNSLSPYTSEQHTFSQLWNRSRIVKLQYENSQNLQVTHYEKGRTGSKEVEPMTQPPLRMYETQTSATLFLYFVRNNEFSQINLLHLLSPNLQRQQFVVLFPVYSRNLFKSSH